MKEVVRLKIILKKTMELIPYINNTRTHDEKQIKQIASSIKEFGFNNPILIDEKGEIIAGHGRLLASELLKLEEVPCIELKHLTKAQKKAYVIADNKIALNAGWNEELLKLEIESLKELDFDLVLLGFDSLELDDLLNFEEEKEIEEDEVPEVDETKEPYSKLGDIWLLGRHRLMCGDSTDKETVEKLMNGQKATLAHNDPPYGMKKENEGVLNDNLNFDDLLEFNKKWINLQFDFLKDNGSFYCWGIDEPLMDIYSNILKPLIKTQKVTFRNLITWNKGNGQGQNSEDFRMYPIADEKCLFVMLGVQGFNNNAGNYFNGWDSVVNYLDSEKNKAKLTIKECKRLAGHSEKSGCHWFDKSQWSFPTKDVYNSWKNYCQENNIEAFKKEYEELKKEYEELKKEYYSTRAYFNNTHDNMNNVWNIQRTTGEEREQTGGHATPKPLKLCERVLNSSSQENDIVLDLFGGSGSTLIACEQTNRINYSMELDEKYVDVIVKRYHNLGKDDIKLIREGKEYTWEEVKEELINNG